MDFTLYQWLLISAIFVWTGFVRTGIGFGGAALGLPLMLIIYNQPLYWLPIIGSHLLFFTSITLARTSAKIDWQHLKQSLWWILPSVFLGILGLLQLPVIVLLLLIYSITIFYGVMWIWGKTFSSHSIWVDRFLYILGGYVSGISLTGGPLLVTVFNRYVVREKLRNTLFMLWVILVSIKMMAFVAFSVPIAWREALILLPIAAIGHVIGLYAHDHLIRSEKFFRRILGAFLIIISILGLLTAV